MKKKSFVAIQLENAAKIYQQRNKEYGDSYKSHGEVMNSFFPNGLELNSVEDFNRFCLFNAVIGKMNRYAQNFNIGGHVDSLDDASVYAQMLQEIDSEIQR